MRSRALKLVLFVAGVVGLLALAQPLQASTTTTAVLRVTPTSLTDEGGTIQVALTVAKATRCTLLSTPAITNLRETVTCKSGKLVREAKVGVNASSSKRTIVVTATVTGGSGRLVRHVNVVEQAPKAPPPPDQSSTTTTVDTTPTNCPPGFTAVGPGECLMA